MDTSEVYDILEANKNEKGIEKWKDRDTGKGALSTYGLGLTVLRKLAKKIGRDRELAAELWKSNVYDAKIISLLIDDPKQITKEQAEMQVEHLGVKHLAHVFSSCDASLAKTPFAAELAYEWVHSKDPMRRSCGYGLLYEESKSKKKTAPDDEFFLERLKYIDETFDTEVLMVKGSMGGALLGIGKRNKTLNSAALKVAKRLGPIEFETESGECEPFNVVKHLTSDYITKKLGL